MTEREHGKQENCPSWCVADHIRQVHPDDARHWGDLGTVPAVELLSDSSGSDLHERSVQIDVGIERAFGARAAHVSLVVDELDERSMLITGDSALRLSHALARAAVATSA